MTPEEQTTQTEPIETPIESIDDGSIPFFEDGDSSLKEEMALMLNTGGVKPDVEEPVFEEVASAEPTLTEEEPITLVDGVTQDEDPKYKELMDKIAALEAKLSPTEDTKSEDEAVVETADQVDGVFQVLKDGEDPTELVTTKEGLNLIATRTINSAIRESLRFAMPVIQAETARVQAIFSYSAEFFRANPDLRPHNATVSAVVEDMLKQNPKANPSEVFVKAGDEARKRLGLPIPNRGPVAPPKKPGFSSVSSSVAAPSRGTGEPTLREDLAALARVK